MADPLRETLDAETVVDDRYRVISRIGSGGMADVYVAEDLQLGRRVALKMLHRRFAEDQEFVERFRREASAAAGLQHPNVVQVYDRGSWDGTWYIAMEYLDGRSLKELIREGAVAPATAVDIAIQILRALRFGHKRGVIHRDIKPHNVIVDAEGRVKVTDFGIARAGASDMTETGAIMGTAQYLSPEQAQGHPVSATADLYSVGIVLYEMLTGQVPFDAETAVTIALKQVSEDPAAIRALNPDVSPELEEVVLRALRKDPRERYVDAEEFVQALEGARDLPARPDQAQRTGRLTGVYPALEAEGWHEDPMAYEAYEEERRRSRAWVPWLLGALALAAVAIGLFLLLQPDEVRVPNVVGRDADVAAARLNNAGFEVEIQEVRSADVPRNKVTRQRPTPGELADEGATVTIFVSEGPGEAIVPDVIDEPERAALRMVRDRGFRVAVDRKFSDTVEEGRVIETRPSPRSQLEIGRTVTLVISRGRESVRMPDVRDLDREAARQRLEDLDLEVTFREQETDEEDPGEVVGQDPAPGTDVEKGSEVTVTVAEQPSRVAVPNVVGAEVNDALDALTEAGLRPRQRTVEVGSPEEDGVVVAQTPDGGTERPRGSRVTITVGRFDPELDPDPTPTPTATP